MLSLLSKLKPSTSKTTKTTAPDTLQDPLSDSLTDILGSGDREQRGGGATGQLQLLGKKQVSTPAPEVDPDDIQSGSSLGTEMGVRAREVNDTMEKARGKPGRLDKLFNTNKNKAWKESQFKDAKAQLTTDIEKVKPYWSEAFAFALKESSANNFEAYEALEGGVPPESVYKTWISNDSNETVNLPNSLVKTLHGQAAKGDFNEMDLAPVLAAVRMNIMQDTIPRFATSDLFRKAWFQKNG